MSALKAAMAIGATTGVGYVIWRLVRPAEAHNAPDSSEAQTSTPTGTQTAPTPGAPTAPTPAAPTPAAPTPAPTPAAPTPAAPTPTRPKPGPSGPRITTSTHDKRTGHVHQSPEQLFIQARQVIPDLTMTEYSAARVIASEHYTGTPIEWAAILDAELGRAPAKLELLTKHLAPLGTYGQQGRGMRKVATTRDPARAHVDAARRVLSGDLRGVSRGAVRFFDPKAQAAMHRKWRSGDTDRQHCAPAIILQRWSFDHPWADKATCALNTARTGKLLEWVGPIDGVDPLRLMLFRPSRGEPTHRAQYEAALALLRDAKLA